MEGVLNEDFIIDIAGGAASRQSYSLGENRGQKQDDRRYSIYLGKVISGDGKRLLSRVDFGR